jgi:hypothetical protein
MRWFLLFLGALSAPAGSSAQNTPKWSAELVRTEKEEQIERLSFNVHKLFVEEKIHRERKVAVVKIEGNYVAEKGGSFFIDGALLPEGSAGSLLIPFSYTKALRGERTPIEFTLNSAGGELTREVVTVSFPWWETFHQVRATDEELRGVRDVRAERLNRKKWNAEFGLNMKQFEFAQTLEAPLKSFFLTPKISGKYQFENPQWSINGSSDFNLISIQEEADDVDVKILGISLGAGYEFPQILSPWKFTLSFALFYSTMLVSDEFGFSNLLSPQLYPVVSREVGERNLASIYLKFSPIANFYRILSLDNREIALGSSWSYVLSDHHIGLTLDFSHLQLQVDGIQIHSSSSSLGLFYRF